MVLNFALAIQHAAAIGNLRAGRAVHAAMLVCGFAPTTFVSNCLLAMYARRGGVGDARKVFDQMQERDTVSYNTLLTAFVLHGSMDAALSLFDAMPHRDVISWNAIISGYNQRGCFGTSLGLLSQMIHDGVMPDRTTLAVMLKSSAALEDIVAGAIIHGLAAKVRLDVDVMTASALVDMYAKCGCLDESRRFFNTMPERNWVSWSAIVAGCTKNEQHAKGLRLFKEMQRSGYGSTQSVYASVFRSCAALACAGIGSQCHVHALKSGFAMDAVVGTAIVDMYAKSNHLSDAVEVFKRLHEPTLESWNAMLVGLVRNRQGHDAIEMFRVMNRSSVGVNAVTLSGLFSACAETKGYFQGMQVHCLALKTGLDLDVSVCNGILDLYGKCEALPEARLVFETMDERDGVSWNAIITALEQNGQYEDTLLHFKEMLQCCMVPDEFTYGSVLKACTALKSVEYGLMVHDNIIKSALGLHPFTVSCVVDMYCKCGMVAEALKLHERTGKQGLVSWNAVISGLSLNNQSEEAQEFFRKMLDMGVQPDKFTYATTLDTCANLATGALGRQIHSQIIKQEMLGDVYIGSTLVDMYAKCGNLEDSLLMFEKMPQRDFVSWNALICGYALHGHGREALRMFNRMQAEGVGPNHATFVSVLRACCHVGLLDDGIHYFNIMSSQYKLEPRLEHYACMVDIVGRLKGSLEALKVINDMPLTADEVVWKTLLSVCINYKDVETAEVAFHNIISINPGDSAPYILLSNVYAEAQKWAKVSELRRLMRQGKVRKEPGCSWIEVMDETHAFLVAEKTHPRSAELNEVLNLLVFEMKREGYVPGIVASSFVEEAEEEEGNKEEQQHRLLISSNWWSL